MTLSPELVTEWIDLFPVAVYLTDAMEHLYSEEAPSSSVQTKHKEEGEKRQKLDSDDRQRIGAEQEKHSHPLSINSDVLYNIVNGQVAPNKVNVSDAVFIGEKMAYSFCTSLPSGLRNSDWEKFRKLRRQASKAAAKFYSYYLNNHIGESLKTNPKQFWSFIKANKREYIGIPTLQTNGQIITSDRDKANTLNNQFSSLFTQEIGVGSIRLLRYPLPRN